MNEPVTEQSTQRLLAVADDAHAAYCSWQRELLSCLPELERRGVWMNQGVHDMPEWISMRYQVSKWTARRWLRAAYALEDLPLVARALERGELSVDKAVELARFATSESEKRLLSWAKRVSPQAVRTRADVDSRPDPGEAESIAATKSLEMWRCDDGKMMALAGALPAAEGEMVKSALDELARSLPVAPGESRDADRLRADALVEVVANGPATGEAAAAEVDVYVDLAAVLAARSGAEIGAGGVLSPEVAERILCDCNLRWVVTGEEGVPIGVGTSQRTPPRWVRRLVKKRDGGCTFPGCERRHGLQAHHVRHWPLGPTDLDNLTLLCPFHHNLIHVHRWRVALGPKGTTAWFRPDGRPFEPGPDPPQVSAA